MDIRLIVVLFLTLVSCQEQASGSREVKTDFAKIESTLSAGNDNIDTITSGSINEYLNLPVIGRIDLNQLELDSSAAYHHENCSGSIQRFSAKRMHFAIDSITCQEAEFINTYYLLNAHDFLQIVFVEKAEHIEGHAIFDGVLMKEETVFDFTTDSLFIMTRVDTISSADRLHQPIDKIFDLEISGDRTSTYSNFRAQYQQAWRRGSSTEPDE